MAIIAALFAYVGRFLGRLLQMTLDWASGLLFGRVPQSKQPILNAIVLGSLAWLVLVAGVVAPSVGTMLLAAVTVPSFIDPLWISLAMLAAALVLPALIGVAGLYLLDPSSRPRDRASIARQVARGYPFAFALGFTVVFVAVYAVARRVRSLARRWSDKHIPVAVKPGGYPRVAADVKAALDRAGLETQAARSPTMLALPPRLIGAVSGRGVAGLVPRELVMFRGPAIEVLLYPSDIAIFGRKEEINRTHAAIVDALPYTEAYVTRTPESQVLEDRLARIAHDGGVDTADGPPPPLGTADSAALSEVDESIGRLDLPDDEWLALHALRVQVERDILRASVHGGREDRGEHDGSSHRSVGHALEAVRALAGTVLPLARDPDGKHRPGSAS